MKKAAFSPEPVSILSLSIPHMDASEARLRLQQALAQHNRCQKIYTPNPQMALRAYYSPALTEMLSHADLLLPDGIGLILGSRLLGRSLPERITGIDAASFVLSEAEKQGLSVALLGAKPRTAEQAAARLRRTFPHLRICYTHHGYFQREGKENESVLDALRTASPDILFVCFGFPAQEIWIDRYAATLPSLRLCMGLGGSLDVWAGNIRRAPRAMSAFGLEWLWRTLREPRRARIFLDIPHFLFLVLQQRKHEKKEMRSCRS